MRKYKYKIVNKNNGSCIVHPNSSLHMKYLKGEDVYAYKDSFGVMVFHTKKSAESFMDLHSSLNYGGFNRSKNWKIKRVVPIGKGSTPKYISRYASTDDIKELMKRIKQNTMDEIYCSYMCMRLNKPITNTICYPGVHVVD